MAAKQELIQWLIDQLASAQLHEGLAGDIGKLRKTAAQIHRAGLQSLCDAINSAKPFVLYLTDFGLEARTYDIYADSYSDTDANTTVMSGVGYSVNKKLGKLDREAFPIIMVANPADILAVRQADGPPRIFVDPDTWRERVYAIINVCPTIAVSLGNCGPGVQWELATLIAQDRTAHTVLIYPESGILIRHDDKPTRSRPVPESADPYVRAVVRVLMQPDDSKVAAVSGEVAKLFNKFRYTAAIESIVEDLKQIVPILFDNYILKNSPAPPLTHEVIGTKEGVKGRLAHLSEIANRAYQHGNARIALEAFEQLLEEQVAALGADHTDTFSTRLYIAGLSSDLGDQDRSVRLCEEVLAGQRRIFSSDNADTLAAKANIAVFNLKAGRVGAALEICDELQVDCQRILGPADSMNLAIRATVAGCIIQTGDKERAYQLYIDLLNDQERVLGNDSPEALTSRHNIAILSCEIEIVNPREGLELLQGVLSDRQRVLGRQHPETLITQENVAYLVERLGPRSEALKAFRSLLGCQERAYGFDHPNTLRTMQKLAELTSDTAGDRDRSIESVPEVIPDPTSDATESSIDSAVPVVVVTEQLQARLSD